MRTSLLAFTCLALAQESAPKEHETIVHRMGSLRWQHGAFISAIAVLPGDRQALSAGYNGAAVLWDLETGVGLRSYEGHKGQIFSLAVFPGGKRFVTAGQDKRVLMWEIESLKPLRAFEGHKDIVRSVAVTSDGSRIVSGGHDSQVIVWDPAADKPIRSMTWPLGSVVSLAVQPGGKLVLVDGKDKTALGDLESGTWVRELGTSSPLDTRIQVGRGMDKVAFAPDGRHAAAYFTYRAVTVWDSKSGAELKILGNKGQSYSAIAFSRDGQRLHLASHRALEIWDVEKGHLVTSLAVGHLYALAETEKGGRLVGTPGDGTVALWDLATGKRLSEAGPGDVFSIACGLDGRTVLAGSRDGSMTQWDLTTGRPLRTFERLSQKKFGDGSPMQDWAASMAVCLDGRRAVSGHWDNRTALWDLATGKLLRDYGALFGTGVQGVTLSPDGKRGAGSGAPAVIWDLDSGEVIHRFKIDPGAYTAAAFSPDGKFLLLGTNSQKITLFDASTGVLVREFTGHPGRVAALDFTIDGRHAVSGSESGEPFQLWDVSTGRSIRSFAFPKGTQPSWGTTLAVSPDGAFLYTRGPAAELLVWDIESGKIVKSFGGHLHTVKAIAFSPGGRFVTTGSADSTVIHRHPGLPFKGKPATDWKGFMTSMRSGDFDAWHETLERGVASGDAIVSKLVGEFPAPECAIDAAKRTAALKDLDQDSVEVRDVARKRLSEWGEGAYAWAREQRNETALSAPVRAALESFLKELESRPLASLESKDVAKLRAVHILLELPDSETRRKGLEHFAKGSMNDVAARLARRYVDHVLRK